jgi:hypothetical protein
MTREESAAIGWAQMLEIEAKRKAGMPHTEVLCEQIVVAVAQYQRDMEIWKDGRWHTQTRQID